MILKNIALNLQQNPAFQNFYFYSLSLSFDQWLFNKNKFNKNKRIKKWRLRSNLSFLFIYHKLSDIIMKLWFT